MSERHLALAEEEQCPCEGEADGLGVVGPRVELKGQPGRHRGPGEQELAERALDRLPGLRRMAGRADGPQECFLVEAVGLAGRAEERALRLLFLALSDPLNLLLDLGFSALSQEPSRLEERRLRRRPTPVSLRGRAVRWPPRGQNREKEHAPNLWRSHDTPPNQVAQHYRLQAPVAQGHALACTSTPTTSSTRPRGLPSRCAGALLVGTPRMACEGFLTLDGASRIIRSICSLLR